MGYQMKSHVISYQMSYGLLWNTLGNPIECHILGFYIISHVITYGILWNLMEYHMKYC